MGEFLTISEAAIIRNVSRQAIFSAIKSNYLNAFKNEEGIWQISYSDLDRYENTRHQRKERSRFNGNRLFEEGKTYTVDDVAKTTGIPKQNIYYLIRSGSLKAEKKGYQFVISLEAYLKIIEEYSKNHNSLVS
jgi:excisionase family DNA binding protein